jgi:demethylmenaquinone methyltransferase / 2-methoxy-6-polyprenyl-1,4-benzoquinol methylase
MTKTTHFGFKQVDEDEKVSKVGDVFKSVAPSYDVMNDLMSGGLHRIWKRAAVELSGVKNGERVLDIAAGSGDLTRLFVKKVRCG